MTTAEAIRAEEEGRVGDAVRLYDEAIAADSEDVTAAINLLILLWQAIDPGEVGTGPNPPMVVRRAFEGFASMLSDLAVALPEDPEVAFWTRYIRWISYGGDFSLEEGRAMRQRWPEYLEPALFIYMQAPAESIDDARDLWRASRLGRTARARYVASVLGSGLRDPDKTFGTDSNG